MIMNLKNVLGNQVALISLPDPQFKELLHYWEICCLDNLNYM